MKTKHAQATIEKAVLRMIRNWSLDTLEEIAYEREMQYFLNEASEDEVDFLIQNEIEDAV